MQTLKNLRDRRLECGHSLRSIGRILGVSHSFLDRIERGECPLPANLVAPLAEALRLELTELIEMAPPSQVDLRGLSAEHRARVLALVDELRGAP